MNVKVYIGGSVIIILSLIQPNLNRDFYPTYSAKLIPERFLDIMWGYVSRMRNRVDSITDIRATYEVSPQYELGYVMGEVLERYRKMVGIIHRPMKFKSDALYDVIKRTEAVEHLFLDILHLMYMVHETKQKYRSKAQFFTSEDNDNLNHTFAILEQERKHREWLRRKREKEMKKIRDALFKTAKVGDSVDNLMTRMTKKRASWWPIDYGWEINYKWW